MFTIKDITLRKVTPLDTHTLVCNANNKKIWDNMRDSFPYPYTIEDAKRFVDRVNIDESQVTMAIVYKEKLIGIISLFLDKDVYSKNAEISYWIGERYWLKGIGTIAVEYMTKYGFEVLKLHRIYAEVFENNVGSMLVLEKNGYKREGVLRDNVFKNGKYLDSVLYGNLNKTPY